MKQEVRPSVQFDVPKCGALSEESRLGHSLQKRIMGYNLQVVGAIKSGHPPDAVIMQVRSQEKKVNKELYSVFTYVTKKAHCTRRL